MSASGGGLCSLVVDELTARAELENRMESAKA